MSVLFASLLVVAILASPVLLMILIIRALRKKPVKKLGISLLICVGAIVPLTILGVLTDPATWCNHDRELVSETQATCTEKGKIVEYCSICDVDVTTYKDKLPHDYQLSDTVAATCTSEGFTTEKCSRCSAMQKTDTIKALGHDMKEISRIEPTEDSDGKVVAKCERCGYTENETIPKDETTSNNDGYL